jgi:GxxExxY protein
MHMDALCDKVREVAFAVHVFHGPGHLEKIYENALTHRLRKAGIAVEQQSSVSVLDEDGTVVGMYVADLLVQGRLLVELKAASRISPTHVAQILGYLKSTRLQYGLLLNFGAHSFEVRRYGSRVFDSRDST